MRMPFGIIGRTSPGIRQVVRFADRSTGRGTLGANLGRPIVSNGDFTAYVCDSAATLPSSHITLGKLWANIGVVRAVGRGIAVLDVGPRRARGTGGFGGFPNFHNGNWY